MPVLSQKAELLKLTTGPRAARASLGLFIKALKCPTGRVMENSRSTIALHTPSAADIFYTDRLEFLTEVGGGQWVYSR